jgi:hypothetical protein
MLMLWAVSQPLMTGSEKESHSLIPGLFFSWLAPDEGYVGVGFYSEDKLREFVSHCQSDRLVYSLPLGSAYRCRAQLFKDPSGKDVWTSAGVTVQGPAAVPVSDDRRYGLFSVQPPSKKWAVRNLSLEESTALRILLTSDDQRIAAIRKRAKLHSARAVHSPGSDQITVVVPGNVVKEGDFYRAQRHFVFEMRPERAIYLGQLPGSPQMYVDVDGGKAPGIVVSEGCDGWCISLWQISSGVRKIATFGGH